MAYPSAAASGAGLAKNDHGRQPVGNEALKGSTRRPGRFSAFLLGWIVTCVAVAAFADPGAEVDLLDGMDSSESQSLAKDSQNPISSLVSLPFENNINYNAGPLNKTDNVFTIKPVYPVSLNEDWNLIHRFLIPIVSRGGRAPNQGREVGLGDITYQGFFSPANSGSLVWGFGPTFVARTGTNDALTSDQWSLGPSAVLVSTPGRWVVGGLLSQIWSFAGDDGAKDISLMNFQPFVNYNLDAGWYLTTAPIVVANWKQSNDNTWTVPVGGGMGRVFMFGKQALNARLAAYYNVEKPRKSSDWTLSTQLTFLFPK